MEVSAGGEGIGPVRHIEGVRVVQEDGQFGQSPGGKTVPYRRSVKGRGMGRRWEVASMSRETNQGPNYEGLCKSRSKI